MANAANHQASARDQRRKFLRDGMDGHHAVVEEEHLPAAVQFPEYGVADQPLVVLRHDGLDRESIVGRQVSVAGPGGAWCAVPQPVPARTAASSSPACAGMILGTCHLSLGAVSRFAHLGQF